MSDASQHDTTWPMLRFGLIVTGRAEEKHSPQLFRFLTATGTCTFKVIRRVEQRSPRTSVTRLRVAGTDRPIPTKDEEEISFPTRSHVETGNLHFVILLDDLEFARRETVQGVYDRYRQTLDHVLRVEQRSRASVHFLVHMLEAYYFGDPQAVNQVLHLNPPLPEHEGDVEEIRNPKADLRHLHRGFNEIEHGGKILARLRVEQVLSDPTTCAWLRTLFAWCVRALERHPHWLDVYQGDPFHLADGIMSPLTRSQIDGL